MVPDLNPEHFQITERDGLRLIVPAHAGAVGNAPWTPRTIKYRSRVETLDGTTVSQGFSKFFNLGMGPAGLNISVEDVAKAVKNYDAVATLKVDGSLLIRSVYNGKVMWRTRGSFGYEFLDNADEMDIFRAQHPVLFNAGKLTSLSLLFEWVSPKNTIVIKYPEPKLTLIGAVQNSSLGYMRINVLEEISKIVGVEVVKWFFLDAKGWDELREIVKTNNEIEGYVIRLNKEQDLVKVKCDAYLTKHGLKSTLNSEKLADMWFQQGQPSFEKFGEQFIKDFDEESYMWALGAISAMFDGIVELKKILFHMSRKAGERSGFTRKEAALAGLAEYGQTKRFAAYMQIWEGKIVNQELLKTILLQNTKQVEIGMFKNQGADI